MPASSRPCAGWAMSAVRNAEAKRVTSIARAINWGYMWRRLMGYVWLTVELGFDGMDFAPVAELCDTLGVPYTRLKTDIKEVVFDVRKEDNPCSLCAKMRRGALCTALSERGITKLALGHHFDDAVETFLLSLVYEGRISCFQPVTHMTRTGVDQIRPMLYAGEGSNSAGVTFKFISDISVFSSL